MIILKVIKMEEKDNKDNTNTPYKQETKQVSFLNVPIDVWQVIGGYLESDDLFSMAATCKRAYKAFSRPILRKRISFPLAEPHRLTMDQRETVKAMESVNFPVKFLSADVGAGKSVTSLAYGLRNNFSRIYIVCPPNLIQMWWDTVIKFFKMDPLVFHSTNKKYKRRAILDNYENKIIITSYLLFGTFPLIDSKNSLLIVDEAHHKVEYSDNFKEKLGLSATAYSKKNVSRGLRDMCEKAGVKPEQILFRMENNVIANKLPPYEVIEPYKFKASEEVQVAVKERLKFTSEGQYDLRFVTSLTECLTHPFAADPLCLITDFKVGKKKFNLLTRFEYEILEGKFGEMMGLQEPKYENYKFNKNGLFSYELYQQYLDDKNIFRHTVEKTMKEQAEEYYQTEKRKCIKYYQLLAILQNVQKRGEKAIVIDNSVTWLPVLYRFLKDKEIESYLFTTHYDVTSRQNQLKKFKENKNAVALISSFGMLGEGHNITEANHVIFLSPTTDINKYHQAIGRAHRYPQNKTVYVYHLFVSKLEEAIYEHAHDYQSLDGRDLKSLLSQ